MLNSVKICVKTTNRGAAYLQPHNLEEVDLWLAPHRGSAATGVVSLTHPQDSLGEADSHLLTHRQQQREYTTQQRLQNATAAELYILL